MRRAAFALAGAAAALSLAACGAESIPGVNSDDSDTRHGKRAQAIVERFAEADGPEACDLLTPAALRRVYGKDEPPGPAPEITAPPPEISLAECRRRSQQFGGEEIEIEKVDVLGDARAARVTAMTDDDRTFSVTLRRKADAWLIDEIREQ
jgi:hypothetical protein